MGGNGQTTADLQKYRDDLAAQGSIDKDESYTLLADIDPPSWALDVNVNPRLDQLRTELNSGDHKDIKLLGFSEGAATVGKYLSETDAIPSSVKGQLRAAVMLEGPFADIPQTVVQGFSTSCLDRLPEKLANAGIDIRLTDMWNTASIVHGGQLEGWGKNSYSYDSRPWWAQVACAVAQLTNAGQAAVNAYRAAGTWVSFHKNIWGNKNVNKKIKETFYKK